MNKYFKKEEILKISGENSCQTFFKENTNKFIIFSSPTSSEAINKFRNLASQKDIIINPDNFAFCTATGIRLWPSFDYSYNLKLKFKNKIKKKKTLNEIVTINPLFPLEHMRKFVFTKADYIHITKIPSMLQQLERIFLAWDLTKFLKINHLNDDYTSIKNFLEASTSESSGSSFNYENLEILGDSVIKIICSIFLYYKFPEENEGFLEKKRVKLLYNENLYNLALKSNLLNYIVNNELEIKNYQNPFHEKNQKMIIQQITRKGLADVLEAITGACLFTKNNFLECINFLKFINLFDDALLIDKSHIIKFRNLNEKQREKLTNEAEALKEKMFNGDDNELFNLIEQRLNVFINHNKINPCLKSYFEPEKEINNVYDILISYEEYEYYSKIINAKKHFLEVFFLNKKQKINYSELLDTISFDSNNSRNSVKSFSNLYEKEYLNLKDDADLELLQKEILEYKFFNIEILKEALIHKSSKNNKQNYERLEFLGDAVLEIFTIFNIFGICRNENFANKNLNCGIITDIKSFLVSNHNLINISLILNLDKYIVYCDNSISEAINDYKSNLNLNFNLDDYQQNYFARPKIISDIFEAIVGAILIDSGILNCFRFLRKVFTPLICFCCDNMQNIKYSVVNEFVEFVNIKFKEQVTFEKMNLNSLNFDDYSMLNEVYKRNYSEKFNDINNKQVDVSPYSQVKNKNFVKIQVAFGGKIYHKAIGQTEEIAKEICCSEAYKKLINELNEEKNISNS